MSWSRRQALGLALLPAAALAGCGFQPMYGGQGRAILAELGTIRVDRPRDRLGQLVRNEIIERMSPRGEPTVVHYKLSYTTRLNEVQLAIQDDNSITRFSLRLTVEVWLLEIASGKVIYRDKTRAVGGYNAVKSDFATLSARLDTADRIARANAEEIVTLLGVFFTRKRAAG
jgi:LPS-assembly lipoprotein